MSALPHVDAAVTGPGSPWWPSKRQAGHHLSRQEGAFPVCVRLDGEGYLSPLDESFHQPPWTAAGLCGGTGRSVHVAHPSRRALTGRPPIPDEADQPVHGSRSGSVHGPGAVSDENQGHQGPERVISATRRGESGGSGHHLPMVTALIGVVFASGSVLALVRDWVRHPEV